MSVIRQHADGSASLQAESDASYSGRHGGPSTGTASAPKHRSPSFAVFGVTGAVTTAGGVFAWRPEDQSRAHYINGLVMDVTTKSTGASTIDIGIGATSTTSSDTLIDGVDAGTAIIVANTQKHAGTNGMGKVKLAAGSYVTASMATGDTTGLVASVLIEYVPA